MGLTTQGRVWIITRLHNTELPAGALMQFVGWGVGVAAEAVTDVAEGTAAPEARVSGTLSTPTTTTSRCVGTITSAGTQSISEVVRVNTLAKGAANQQCLQRHVFTAIPLVASDSIQFTLDLLD